MVELRTRANSSCVSSHVSDLAIRLGKDVPLSTILSNVEGWWPSPPVEAGTGKTDWILQFANQAITVNSDAAKTTSRLIKVFIYVHESPNSSRPSMCAYPKRIAEKHPLRSNLVLPENASLHVCVPNSHQACQQNGLGDYAKPGRLGLTNSPSLFSRTVRPSILSHTS